MKYTFPIKEKMVCASSTFSISYLNAEKVCKVLNRKKFIDAKNLLEKIVNEEVSIKGKYYTKTSKEILRLLNQLENNARAREIASDNMILFISANKGAKIQRSRRSSKFGTRLKQSHVKAVLSEEYGFGKKVRERGNKK